MKKEIIAKFDNKYTLIKENNNFYYIEGLNYVDMAGNKEELKKN